jgi:hypothetical protein
MAQTFIYAIYCPNKKEVKIGYATDPIKRLSQLQVGTTDRLDLLISFRGGAEEERRIHTVLSEYRLSGEWFIYNSFLLSVLNNFYTLNFPVPEDRLNDGSVETVILSRAGEIMESRGNRKSLTIPEIKKSLPMVDLSTKEIQDILLKNDWEYTTSGTCPTKFFKPKQTS